MFAHNCSHSNFDNFTQTGPSSVKGWEDGREGLGVAQNLGQNRAGAKGSHLRDACPCCLCRGRGKWPTEGYRAHPRESPGKHPVAGMIFADAEEKDGVTAPRELTGSFQGLIQGTRAQEGAPE